MPAALIQANYEALDAVAKKFKQHEEQTQAMVQHVMRGVNALRDGGWEGRGREAFLRAMDDEILPAVQRLVGALEQANLTTTALVKIMQTAEAEAARLFQDDEQATSNPKPATSKADSDGGKNGLLDVITDYVPGVSNVKDAITAITGENPVTGEEVGTGGRILAGVFAIPGVGLIGKGGKAIFKGGKAIFKGGSKFIKGGLGWLKKAGGKLRLGRGSSHVDDVHPSTPIGRSGNPLDMPNRVNKPTMINGRQYTGHALDSMQKRGIMPSVVEDTIRHNPPTPDKEPGKLVYRSEINNLKVITDSKTGRVVTVFETRKKK